MAKLIIDGLTPNQAKVLADWYDGQGEQDASIWFDYNGNGDEAPMVDNGREGGCEEIDADGNVTLHCESPR